MIPLLHDSEPVELKDFVNYTPGVKVEDFDSQQFLPIKQIVKERLVTLQHGRCVYCERRFGDTLLPQVEHIKPKSGLNAHPYLCFTYQNYAASCIQQVKNKTTCGQQKKSGVLPVEPTDLNCNDYYILNTDGEIHPISTSTRRDKHSRRSSIDMLGLNKPFLSLLRKKRIHQLLEVMKLNPSLAPKFIESGDFCFILRRLAP